MFNKMSEKNPYKYNGEALVVENDNGIMGISYPDLIAHLVVSIQSLEKRIQELEKNVN